MLGVWLELCNQRRIHQIRFSLQARMPLHVLLDRIHLAWIAIKGRCQTCNAPPLLNICALRAADNYIWCNACASCILARCVTQTATAEVKNQFENKLSSSPQTRGTHQTWWHCILCLFLAHMYNLQRTGRWTRLVSKQRPSTPLLTIPHAEKKTFPTTQERASSQVVNRGCWWQQCWRLPAWDVSKCATGSTTIRSGDTGLVQK